MKKFAKPAPAKADESVEASAKTEEAPASAEATADKKAE